MNSVQLSRNAYLGFAAAVLLIVLCLPETTHGEGSFVGGTDQAIALRSAQILFEDAKVRLERSVELHEQRILSVAALKQEQVKFRLAQLELSQAYINAAMAQPQIVVEKAVKYQAEDGRKRVRLTLANLTAGAIDFSKLSGDEGAEILTDLRLDEVVNILVSLKSPSGHKEGVLLEKTIISDPYETQIDSIRAGESFTFDVGLLLEDVDETVVSMKYAGRLEERQILLHKDSGANVVSVFSSQVSLDVALGEEATYDLTLERFTAQADSFRLLTVGLPLEISHEFVDGASGVRLSQIFFPRGITTKHLQLTLHMPERPVGEVETDQPLSFSVAVVSQGSYERLEETELQQLTHEQVAFHGGGMIELEVLPRGVAELDVEAVQLYHVIEPLEAAELELTVRNVGSRRVDQVTCSNEIPYRWRSAVEPPSLPFLKPGEEGIFNVTLRPPEDVVMGDYEAKIAISGLGGERTVVSNSKAVRVHINAPKNVAGMLSLGLLLTAILVVTLVVGVRLSRR